MSHLLSLSEVVITEIRETDPLLLGNYNDAGSNLLDTLAGPMSKFALSATREDNTIDPKAKSATVEDSRLHTDDASDDKNCLSILIRIGKGGETFDAVRAQAETVSIRPDDRLERRCLALLYLPRNTRSGLLVSHMADGQGIKADLMAHLAASLRSAEENHILRISGTVPDSIMKQTLEAANPRELTFTTLSKDAQFSSLTGLSKSKEFRVKISVKPVGGHFLKDAPKMVAKLMGVDGAGFSVAEMTPSEVFFDCVVSGRSRKVVVKPDQSSIDRMSFDVTDDLHTGEDGFPTYDSLHKAALDLARDVLGTT